MCASHQIGVPSFRLLHTSKFPAPLAVSSAAISRARRSASPVTACQLMSATGRPAHSSGAVAQDLAEPPVRVDDRGIRGPNEAHALRRTVEHEPLQPQPLLQPGVVGHVVPGRHEPARQGRGADLHGPSELAAAV